MSEKNKTIKEKMSNLSKMIAWFDSEDFNLEEAIDRFNQTEKLAIEIENDLNELKNEINVIKKKFDSEK
ncbi:MAG: hypothetical protein PHO93_04075 [Candidatus Saccharimonadaceae bacterium]|nr:hypothetical protein [Candidatus Saccharimonadaceae bacterium]